MPNATARAYRVGYVKETTQGTTPASPLKLLRTTGGGGTFSPQSTQSEELGQNEVSDVIRTGVELGGSFNFLLSYGLIDELLEGIMGGAWTTNVLKVGSTKIPFTFEDQYPDVPLYNTFRGALIQQITLTFARDQVVSGSVQYRAMSLVSGAVSAGTGGPTAAPTNAVMGPVNEIRAAMEGGSKNLLSDGITEFSLTISRPMIAQPTLGSLSLIGLDADALSLTGQFTVYYPDDALYAKLRADTTTSLSFTVGGASTLRYVFLMSRVRLTGGGPQAAQRGQAIRATYQFQATLDPTNSTLQITRTP